MEDKLRSYIIGFVKKSLGKVGDKTKTFGKNFQNDYSESLTHASSLDHPSDSTFDQTQLSSDDLTSLKSFIGEEESTETLESNGNDEDDIEDIKKIVANQISYFNQQEVATLEEEFRTISDKGSEEIISADHPLMKELQKTLKEKLQKTFDDLNQKNLQQLSSLQGTRAIKRDLSLTLYNQQKHSNYLKEKVDSLKKENVKLDGELKRISDQKLQLETDLNSVVEGVREEHRLIREARKSRENLELQTSQLEYIKDKLKDEKKITETKINKTIEDLKFESESKASQDSMLDHINLIIDQKRNEIERLEEETSHENAISTRLGAECGNYEACIAQKQILIDVCQEKIEEARKEVEKRNIFQFNIRKELDKIEAENRSLKLERKIKQKDLYDKKKSVEEMISRNKKLEVSLEDSEKQAELIKSKKECLKLEITKKNDVIRDNENKLSKLEKDYRNVKDEKKILESKILKEIEKKNVLEGEKTKIILDLNLENKECREIFEGIRNIKVNCNDIEYKYNTMTNKLAKINLQLNQMEKNYKSSTNNLYEIKTANEEHDSHLKDLELSISEHQSDIQKNMKYLEKLNTQISKVKAENGGVDLSPLEIESESLLKSIETLKRENRDLERSWLKSRDDLVSRRLKYESLKNESEKIVQELEIREHQEKNLCNKIHSFDYKQKQIEDRTEAMRNELERLGERGDKERQKMEINDEKLLKEETNLLQLIEESQNQIDDSESKILDLKSTVENLTREISGIEIQLAKWCEKLEIVREIKENVDGQEARGDIKSLELEIHNLKLEQNELKRKQEMTLLSLKKLANIKSENIYKLNCIDKNANYRSNFDRNSKASIDLKIIEEKRKIRDIIDNIENLEKEVKESFGKNEGLRENLSKAENQLKKLISTFASMQCHKSGLESKCVAMRIQNGALQEIQKFLQAQKDDSKQQALKTIESKSDEIFKDQLNRLSLQSNTSLVVLKSIVEGKNESFRALIDDQNSDQLIQYLKEFLENKN
ncbi:MAG: Coiled-coil domain-containing protein 40 [Marteilia pararefringens]